MTSPRASGPRLDAIVSQSSEPAFLLGPDRRLAWVNGAFERLAGQPADRLVGLLCRPHGPTRPGDLEGLGGSIYPPPEAMAGRPAGALTYFLSDEGEALSRRVDYRPFLADDGTLLGILGLVRVPEGPAPESDSLAFRLRAELLGARFRPDRRPRVDALVGRGPSHRRLVEQVAAAAASGSSALILGEPGTGKRTVARTIHALGPTRTAPLLPFDTGALPPEVLARELFGRQDQEEPRAPAEDRLAQPDGASLLIFDVLDLPLDIQARLSKSLDGRVRLLATTSGDPEAALRSDRLRSDFYCAISPIVLRLLPLRDRFEELPLLSQHFLERANRRKGEQREGFTDEAIQALTSYDWPGNLRELARVIDAAHQGASGDRIGLLDLPGGIRGERGGAYLPPKAPQGVNLDEILNRVERRLIEQSLAQARQNKSRAAELLGISRPRLYRRIKELGIADESEPAADAPATSAGGLP